MGTVRSFVNKHYRHFNAAVVKSASTAYAMHVEQGGKMMITLAGAMSTAELGISLAEMIRNNKVHIICCTGANLEEDVFNLVAHNAYKRVPGYRYFTAAMEQELYNQQYNRVTDTCIPEDEAMRYIEGHILELWKKSESGKERLFPHEFMYRLLRSGVLESDYKIDPCDSWLMAAGEKDIPIIVPGWEDSTLGNMFAAHCLNEEIHPRTVKSGIEYMIFLADWYKKNSGGKGVGFFQIGGGIAGDFPICVVPMLHQDLGLKEIPLWQYFCQISDSTTSYGSYSGAVPNEKITWGKLDVNTPSFIIESDASIVAPLIFAHVLDW